MDVELRFFNGTIGLGIQALLLADRHGLVFDLGTPFEAGIGPYNSFVQPRPGKEIEDLLRVGWAPPIAGLFAGDPVLHAADAVHDLDGLAAFTSHADPDHAALLPYVRPDVPVHALPGTVRALRALGIDHRGLRAVDPNHEFELGPIRVQVLPVDHGPDGAAGFIAHVGDVRVAYSGDWRWHGDAPHLVDAFVDACRSARIDALLVEATRAAPPAEAAGVQARPELRASDVPALADAALARGNDVVLHSFYDRNVATLEVFLAAFARAGRQLVAHPDSVGFLDAWYEGVPGRPRVLSYADPAVVDAVVRHPERYVVEQRLEDFPLLAEVLERARTLHGRPLAPLLLQGDGFPLGPFDPAWETLHTWWSLLRIERIRMNVNGHALPEDLDRFVAAVDPALVVPLHTWAPHAVAPWHACVHVPRRGEPLRLSSRPPIAF